ncbi:hypothetical protein D9619_011262 [Psilocybe cf. subviscida]|uniref:Uncharacterized protein n=1 Tax=Psilocybe cf. subviscida TaxID=2480587 RepID=A0A8H5F5F6_9AGAR|nr:hypothetical protein D9619_011262 [Psilocybe cf. subviscida]
MKHWIKQSTSKRRQRTAIQHPPCRDDDDHGEIMLNFFEADPTDPAAMTTAVSCILLLMCSHPTFNLPSPSYPFMHSLWNGCNTAPKHNPSDNDPQNPRLRASLPPLSRSASSSYHHHIFFLYSFAAQHFHFIIDIDILRGVRAVTLLPRDEVWHLPRRSSLPPHRLPTRLPASSRCEYDVVRR